jgi:pilus assembly protein Flp/PilA
MDELEVNLTLDWERVAMNIFARFMKDESGATAIEYGLIAALVGVFIITSLQTLGTGLDAIFAGVGGELSTAAGGL